MTVSDQFSTFLTNIKLDNDDQLQSRYSEITLKLNKRFRNSDSTTANRLQVGSYGRYTGIKGISDLDMLYIMPNYLWDDYKNDPAKLLRHTRDALKERYPKTDITYDTLIVIVNFGNFKFEVQPVFEIELEDGSIAYKYPYTKNGGSYRVTKPRHEQAEMTRFRNEYGDTHRRLCKIMRSWINNVGLKMGGLLLDTLAYNFMKDDEDVARTSLSHFDELCRDFFEFLMNEPARDHYQALGSGQDVKVKKKFHSKAKDAYTIACDAISATDEEDRHDKWRDIFGKNFPKAESTTTNKSSNCRVVHFDDNEQFIEDIYSINIQGSLKIDCEIKSNGFREKFLSQILREHLHIGRIRSLDFFIEKCDIEEPFNVRWKVRNVGAEAKRRNCLRGEILYPNIRNSTSRHETADFTGPHYVECYIIKNGYVVARDRINVPIL